MAQAQKLDKPGAGLPEKDRRRFNRLIHSVARVIPQFLLHSLYNRECQKCLDLASQLPPDLASQRVLIAPLPGIEDSSRNWSVYMTLQHIEIVDTGISILIVALRKNRDPGQIVRIEDVKPRDDADENTMASLRKAIKVSKELLNTTAAISTKKWEHPWFGPLNHRQWFFLRCLHPRIHRKQIEAIIDRLPANAA